MNKILDYFFGNKIKIVTGTTLRSYMKFEQQFLFHKDTPNETIREFLWKQKYYSIENIKNIRSKKIISPEYNHWREFTKEKCIKFYD